LSFLKADNIKLKEEVERLEQRIMNMAGSIKIFSSGMTGHESDMNNQLGNVISTADTELKIVAPYITQEYVLLLQDRAKNKVKIQIVLNDRRFWPDVHAKFYDQLKVTTDIDLINNPNVQYLLVWTPKEAIFTSGPLDKHALQKTVLIGTYIKEKLKLDELLTIFKEMLPTFMR
jgi:hypothetical protein